MKTRTTLNKLFVIITSLALSALLGCGGEVFKNLLAGGPQIISIALSPADETVPSGVPVEFSVIATFSNNTSRALTAAEMAQVIWSNDSPTGLASVDVQPATNPANVMITAIKDEYNDGIDLTIALQAEFRHFTATTGLTLNDADLVSISITPGVATIRKLTTQKFKANGIYTDGSVHDISTAVTWLSDAPAIANITTSNGTVTGYSSGVAKISASLGMINSTTPAELTVETPTLVSVSVTPVNRTIPAGYNLQFHATAIYNDDSTQDVTDVANWNSSTVKATINNTTNKGLATGVNDGSTVITATFDSVPGTTNLTVTSATLQYITVTANTNSIADGTKLQLTATGVYSDNTTQNLTNDPSLTWGSSSTAVADFLSAGDPAGMITAQSPGSTNITATLVVTSPAYALTVTNATLSSIIITPADPVAYVIAYGTNQQFTATGVFSDSTTQDLTSLVDWSSSDTAIANINESGLATTADEGTSAIWAKYPKDGPYTVDKDTNLQVIFLTLDTIEVSPATKSTWVGQTMQYTATGTYVGGYTQDLSDQVLWESSSAAASISNSTGSKGLATALSAGSANITATRGGKTSNSAVLTVAASDTEAPIMVSAQLLTGNRVRVTFSEPMDYASAMNTVNYKVMTTASVGSEICDDNGNFENTGASMLISSIDFYSQSVYILNLGVGTNNTQYMVIGNKNALKDVASPVPNTLGCSNKATFNGIDTVKPYLVSVVNSEPTKIIMKYSEPVTTGGGTTAADNMTNYILLENTSDGNDSNNISITSITKIDDATYALNLDKTTQSLLYRIEVKEKVTDQAPTPNTMGSPRILTFTGNEQLKVISAFATGLYEIKVSFSKPVTTASAECSGAVDCHTKYKLFPRSSVNPYPALLGDITKAVRGSGEETNTVTLTHATVQEGISYTVAVANGKDGDGFDNDESTTPIRIVSTTGSSDYVQAAPKDRATFIGLGDVIDDITDGEYFTDPFADGSSFSWSFVYSGKVYLGTNDKNTGAFRFDPDGYNSVLVNFDFVDGIILSPLCPGTDGYGYGTGATCGTDMGYNGERGVVGFTSATVTVSSTNYELLLTGPIKDGVTHGYFTQDVDTVLDWIPVGFSVTGGGNTKSIQTPYAIDNHLYLGFSSAHGQQAPIVSHHDVTAPGGAVMVAEGTDMGIRGVNELGKQGSPANTALYVGIDSMIKYKGNLYMANNGGIRYSGDLMDFALNFSSTPSALTGTTLWLQGLEKVSPGYKGVPKLLEYNGNLYMARNVTDGTPDNYHRLRGELWKCVPGGDNVCDPGDWARIITGAETDLTASAISLLQNNGSGKLYVGFDHESGVTIWRISSTNPPATTDAGGTTMAGAGWVQQGATGLSGSHTTIYSSATITDGTYDYIYITAGGGGQAIRVYRQRE